MRFNAWFLHNAGPLCAKITPMGLQFQQDDSLRAQRMTADEAKAVIDLWQQERVEQTGLTDQPAVPDVAEGLDIGVEDVQRLLQEVRTCRAEEERALAQEQELSQIRLAEEERKLAEIQRQRAELRREQMDRYQQRFPKRMILEKPSDLIWPIGSLVAIILLWMILALLHML